jgi:hypothetical protein
MVRRGDHHGVDVVAGQQFAEIGVGFALIKLATASRRSE